MLPEHTQPQRQRDHEAEREGDDEANLPHRRTGNRPWGTDLPGGEPDEERDPAQRNEETQSDARTRDVDECDSDGEERVSE